MSAPVYTPQTDPLGTRGDDRDVARRGRRLRTFIGLVLLAAFCAGLYQIFGMLTAQPVQVVRIGGKLERLSRQRLEAAIAPHIGVGLLEVDVNAVREAAASLPWVRDVSVRRVWPDGVHVSLREREAFARWNEHGLLDVGGAPFTPSPESMPLGLPSLHGPPGRETEVLAQFDSLGRVVTRAGCGRITMLRLTPRGAWVARLDSGTVIQLGREPSLGAVASYLYALPRVVAGRLGDVASVDLRYPNGFALRFKPGTQDESDEANRADTAFTPGAPAPRVAAGSQETGPNPDLATRTAAPAPIQG